MAEPKGRSGKKPKYQIADIGGADLTSEDISTERVLNFLIKGDLGAVTEKASPTVGSRKSESPAPSVTESHSNKLPDLQEVPDAADQPIKKSLSHLFERAGGGISTAANKEPYIEAEVGRPQAFNEDASPPEAQPIAPEAFSEAAVDPGSPGQVLGARPPERDRLPTSQPALTGSRLEGKQFPPPQRTISEALPESTELESKLTDFVDRWKNLYRLKPGEIAALSTMFRMAYGRSHSECYVKMHKLAEISTLDYRYCQKVVRSLERLGWITKLQDYDPSTQRGVLYRVNSKPLHLT